MKLYVASSWRNPWQPDVVAILRAAGHDVYDFRHPPAGDHLGFSWADVDPNWRSWTTSEYTAALQHPIAQAGFDSDFGAMKWADAGVLVLPSGRSAHLEAGYFVGAGKPLHILLDAGEFIEGAAHSVIELMYLMADSVDVIEPRLPQLVARLRPGLDVTQARETVDAMLPKGWRVDTRACGEQAVAIGNPAWQVQAYKGDRAINGWGHTEAVALTDLAARLAADPEPTRE